MGEGREVYGTSENEATRVKPFCPHRAPLNLATNTAGFKLRATDCCWMTYMIHRVHLSVRWVRPTHDEPNVQRYSSDSP